MITVYRVSTGYRHSPGQTVKDIIDYERDELGNTMNVQDELLGVFAFYPANCCVWACFELQHARRYGNYVDVIEIEMPLVLCDDGDHGYLILDLALARIQV